MSNGLAVFRWCGFKWY